MQKELYVQLKELREKNGLSQTEVSDYLNVSRQAISQWETGKRYPDVSNIIQLSKLYRITTDELLGCAEAKPSCIEKTSLEGENAENNNTKKTIHSNTEILSVLVVLALASQIAFVGVLLPIAVVFWMIKNKKKSKFIYIASLFALLIGMYNTYAIISYHFLSDIGTYMVEPL